MYIFRFYCSKNTTFCTDDERRTILSIIRDFKDKLDYNISIVVDYPTYEKISNMANVNNKSMSETVRELLQIALNEKE